MCEPDTQAHTDTHYTQSALVCVIPVHTTCTDRPQRCRRGQLRYQPCFQWGSTRCPSHCPPFQGGPRELLSGAAVLRLRVTMRCKCQGSPTRTPRRCWQTVRGKRDCTPAIPAPTPPARAPQPGLMSDGMQDVHAPCSRSRRRHGRASHSAPKQTRRSTAHGQATVHTAAMMTRARAAARDSNGFTRTPGARTRTRAVAYLGLADYPAGKGVDERLSLPRVRGAQNSRHGEPDASHVPQPRIWSLPPPRASGYRPSTAGRTRKTESHERWCCARHRQRHRQQQEPIKE